ncbi:spore coat protein [Thermohalobacter berrensis]|uniref:Spore coat protein n=1 Tax=Thermohalobacter berrensis TaxID=99594 RepID=A0A419SWC2_9FIRM|nr:spore coat protein [Thermohalobacter berrensis]RKD29509.1 spore coat protein [Thermohalobacter berrensis]
MTSFLGNKVKQNTDINDEVIADNLMASAKAAANAYLNASLISTTPELRSMYSSSLSQVMSGHAALSELALKRGWAKPYDSPTQQLSSEYSKSKFVVRTEG